MPSLTLAPVARSFGLGALPLLFLLPLLPLALALSTVTSCSLLNAPDDVIPAPPPDAGLGGAGGAGGAGGSDAGGGGSGGAPIIPVCKNGILEPGEACDDGNGDTGDACSPECTITEFDVEADPSIGNEWPGIGLSGADGGKGFFVIWRYLGMPNEIRGRAYKPSGQRVTQSPVKLSSSPQPDQARIGTTPDGRSLVAWRSFADNNQVHYRIVEPDGSAAGPGDEFFEGSQSNALVSVGANGAGKMCLMWMAEGDPADPADEVRVRCFDETGSAAGTATQTLSSTSNSGFPGIWGIKDGFIASWNSDDGKLGSMYLDNQGVMASLKFSLAANANANRNPFGAYVGPALQFIAVFEQNVDLNGQQLPRITMRLFDAPNMSQKLEELVSIKHTFQYQSRVAQHTNGRFVIVWADEDSELMESANIVARVFNQDGSPVGPEFVVNQRKEGTQSWPGVAVNSDGDAMFVWDNNVPEKKFHIAGVIMPRLLADAPK